MSSPVISNELRRILKQRPDLCELLNVICTLPEELRGYLIASALQYAWKLENMSKI